MSHEMEVEDYLHQMRAENGAQREQIDNLVAVVVTRDKRIAELEDELAKRDERIARMTETLDDVLGVVRRREEAARADIARQEQEAEL